MFLRLRRAQAGRGARRRAADLDACSTGSASPASSAAACGSPPRRRWTSSAWCSSGRSGRELVGPDQRSTGPFAVGLSGEDGGLFTAERTPARRRRRAVDIGLVGDVVEVDPDAVPRPARRRADPGRVRRRPRRDGVSCTTSTPTPPPRRWRSRSAPRSSSSSPTSRGSTPTGRTATRA